MLRVSPSSVRMRCFGDTRQVNLIGGTSLAKKALDSFWDVTGIAAPPDSNLPPDIDDDGVGHYEMTQDAAS